MFPASARLTYLYDRHLVLVLVHFASLLTELRTAFNNLQSQKGDATPYELTVRPSLNVRIRAVLIW